MAGASEASSSYQDVTDAYDAYSVNARLTRPPSPQRGQTRDHIRSRCCNRRRRIQLSCRRQVHILLTVSLLCFALSRMFDICTLFIEPKAARDAQFEPADCVLCSAAAVLILLPVILLCKAKPPNFPCTGLVKAVDRPAALLHILPVIGIGATPGI